jgi:prophage regulatory protein
MRTTIPSPTAATTATICRLPDVMRMTGLSRSSIYAAVAEGRFPAPVRLGVRAVGWPRESVEQWIADRPCARPAK